MFAYDPAILAADDDLDKTISNLQNAVKAVNKWTNI